MTTLNPQYVTDKKGRKTAVILKIKEFQKLLEELEDADEITIDLAEEVSFLNKAAIKKTLKNIKPNSKVIFNAKKTSYISDDILEMIEDFANVRAKEEDMEVVLQGFKTTYKDYAVDQHSHIKITHRRAI